MSEDEYVQRKMKYVIGDSEYRKKKEKGFREEYRRRHVIVKESVDTPSPTLSPTKTALEKIKVESMIEKA